MMPRFVILRHDPPPAGEVRVHWDFMLEAGEMLQTWALEQEPVYKVTIRARQLADHRHTYLEYEGPVSGGRGMVTRWDAGEFTWRVQSDSERVIDLNGSILHGHARLTRLEPEPHGWRVLFSPKPFKEVC
jgi:hypothetical protein